MRNPRTIAAVFIALLCIASAQTKLVVKMEEPKRSGQKTVIQLSLKNSFTQKVESARATVFLIDDDKVVGQSAQWVIGGTKDKPTLAPKASTSYNFVIKTDKPFSKTKLIFNRIILEGGKQVDPTKNVEIEK